MIDYFNGKYEFLSNFFPSKIADAHFSYPTVEHYFQAAKTLDLSLRAQIAAAETPGKAKRLGRHIPLREDWEQVKTQVMEEALRLKFEDRELRIQLLNTGKEFLKEGNFWHDNVWGDCSCERCKNITGQNNLGRLLMKIRNELQIEQEFIQNGWL